MYAYTKTELERLDTLDQSWDGAELKFEDEVDPDKLYVNF